MALSFLPGDWSPAPTPSRRVHCLRFLLTLQSTDFTKLRVSHARAHTRAHTHMHAHVRAHACFWTLLCSTDLLVTLPPVPQRFRGRDPAPRSCMWEGEHSHGGLFLFHFFFPLWLFTNYTETDLNFYKMHLLIRGNAPNCR